MLGSIEKGEMRMSEKETGGPAFPWDEKNDDGSYYHGTPGMTLRDYFAGQALITLTETGMAHKMKASMVAQAAYEIADAMLEARK